MLILSQRSTYVHHNLEALADLLGKDSCLEAFGIIDQPRLSKIFADPECVQRHAESLLPAAGAPIDEADPGNKETAARYTTRKELSARHARHVI